MGNQQFEQLGKKQTKSNKKTKKKQPATTNNIDLRAITSDFVNEQISCMNGIYHDIMQHGLKKMKSLMVYVALNLEHISLQMT